MAATTTDEWKPKLYKPRPKVADHIPSKKIFERDIPFVDSLNTDHTVTPICGYTGHMTGFRDDAIAKTYDEVIKKLKINSKHERHRKRADELGWCTAKLSKVDGRTSGHGDNVAQSNLGSMFTNFRKFQAHEELRDRYQSAIKKSLLLGTSQEQLLKLVLGKIYEKAKCTSDLTIRLRKMFEYFDLDGSKQLDEEEFRQCLELMNIQLDDCQSLALFALFDRDMGGDVDFDEFFQVFLKHFSIGATGVL